MEAQAQSAPTCQAVSRRGAPCARPALPGRTLCLYHGRGAGARPGNQNARKHGVYSRHRPAPRREQFDEALLVEGSDAEIALIRVCIGDALRDEHPNPLTIFKGIEVLNQTRRTEHLIASKAQGSLVAALTDVLENHGIPMGLPEALQTADPESPQDPA